MNVLASECSSGCESGWTLYFEHSINPSKREKNMSFGHKIKGKKVENEEVDDYGYQEEEEEEEDLSMVSDASSGPPHLVEDHHEEQHHQGYFSNFKNSVYGSSTSNGYHCRTSRSKCGGKRQKLKEHQHHHHHHHHTNHQDLPSSLLDDTASSPLFNFFPKKEFNLSENRASIESGVEHSYSNGFSATDFEERSAFQEHFSCLRPSFNGGQM